MKIKSQFKLTYKEWLGKMFAMYKNESAGKRGLTFTLTMEDIEELLVEKKCFYCEKRGTYTHDTQDKGVIRSCGIDRVNNTEGYTKINCVPCCKMCNRTKGAMLIG